MGFSPPTGSSGFITRPVSACTMLDSASLVKANYKASPDSQVEMPGWTLFARSHKVNCQSAYSQVKKLRPIFPIYHKEPLPTLGHISVCLFLGPFCLFLPILSFPPCLPLFFVLFFKCLLNTNYAPSTGVTAIRFDSSCCESLVKDLTMQNVTIYKRAFLFSF